MQQTEPSENRQILPVFCVLWRCNVHKTILNNYDCNIQTDFDDCARQVNNFLCVGHSDESPLYEHSASTKPADWWHLNSYISGTVNLVACIGIIAGAAAEDRAVSGLQPTLTESVIQDRFGAALAELEQRLLRVEDENRQLHQRLNAADPVLEIPEPAIDDSGLPACNDPGAELTSLRTVPAPQSAAATAEPKKEKKWFEKYTIRGYAQLRFNDVLDSDGAAAAQTVGDSSIGDRQSFLLRRVRMIIQGDVSEHVSLYFQPDFASAVPGSPDGNQYGQIRDMYADVHLDDQKELRFRIGQSKVPYGWENLQSSSNRLPLDRNDALNSSFKNERDLGVFFYWTPLEVQEFFKYVNDEGLKGSGNYGMFGIGFCNGQGGSLREQNDNLCLVARLTVPFEYGEGRHAEIGMQGYTGQYGVLGSPISPLGAGPAVRPSGTVETGETGLRDERLAWTFVAYPEPIGFQAEWNVGNGPALNASQTAIGVESLTGGYAMIMGRRKLKKGELLPFARWNYFEGGYKTERNAPFVNVEEWELGLEWQFSKSLELVTMYTLTDRTSTTALSSANSRSYQQFEGQLVRCQVQVTW